MNSRLDNSDPLTAEVSEKVRIDRVDAWALPGFLVILTLLCFGHVVYLSFSGLTPGADEAHYMSGALGIADGLRTGTLSGAWAGYLSALGYKAPLICVPAGFFMLFTKSSTLPFSVQLVLVFAGLGLATYSLFRNCFDKVQAACGTIILLCMPLITGLTHRYYTESLLLLLTVVTCDYLLRIGWRSFPAAGLLGVLIGIGVLAKTTFAIFLVPAIGFSLWLELFRNQRSFSIGALLTLILKILIAGVAVLLVAGPWYAKNWDLVIAHMRDSAGADSFYYAHWIIADLSSGPSIVVAVFSLIGIVKLVLGRHEARRDPRAFQAWVVILAVGISTVAGITASAAKAARFEVTVLPMFAALAVAAFSPLRPGAGGEWSRKGFILAAFSVILALQNCYQILPVPPLRFGDAQIFDSTFSLNTPEYFDDNSYLDRRPFDSLESEAEAKIAMDADARLGKGVAVKVATTEAGLLLNHYYFEFLSAFRRHTVHYLPWWVHPVSTGPDSPDYILHTRGLDGIYKGSRFYRYYPQIDDDVARHLFPYKQLFRLNGPSGSEIVVFVKESQSLIEASANSTILLEAEEFQRGNVSIDKAIGSYGEGIGVIVTKSPGGFAEYSVRLPSRGDYQIQVRYASLIPRPLTVLIDGRLITRSAAARTTGGFMPANQIWVPVATVSLTEGVHQLRLETSELFPHVDRIAITKIPAGTQR